MSPQMIALIKSHIKRYPEVELVDIYKLLYQIANGPKHYAVVFDADQYFQEWASAPAENFPPTEAISADGRLVRAHWGPLREMGMDPNALMEIFWQTVFHYQPHPEYLIHWWRDLRDLIIRGELPFPLSQYNELDAEFQQWGFVPKHHSESFVRAYNPHYFVVLKSLIEPFLERLRNKS